MSDARQKLQSKVQQLRAEIVQSAGNAWSDELRSEFDAAFEACVSLDDWRVPSAASDEIERTVWEIVEQVSARLARRDNTVEQQRYKSFFFFFFFLKTRSFS